MNLNNNYNLCLIDDMMIIESILEETDNDAHFKNMDKD